MHICIDVGNSTIGIGVFENNVLVKRMIFNTDTRLTEDEFFLLLKKPFEDISTKVEKVIFSSVVPPINISLIGAINKLFKVAPMLIANDTKTDLAIKVDNPMEIGNDLIADLVGAKEKYGYPCLIADLGTASKILLLDKNGAFSSCVIMPGLSLSANSLTNKAALLPEVSLEAPKTVLAKNTIEAMNAGIVFGHIDMINGLIERYEKEIGYETKHVLTGGSAIYLKEKIGNSFIYDPHLALDGLNILLRRNEVKL